MDFEGGRGDIVLRGIAAIVTCIVLVFVLVFFTNRDALKEKFSGREKTHEASGTITVEAEGSRTEYGLQIGDNLKAFLADDSFFDDYTAAPVAEDYIEEEVISVSVLAVVEDGDVVIRLYNGAGVVLKGERFKANLSREEAGRQIDLVFIDDDEDGVIRAKGLTNGEWQLTLQELDGYHVPTQPAKVTIGSDADGGNTADNGNNSNNGNTAGNGNNSDTGSSSNTGSSEDNSNNNNTADSGASN